MRDSGYSVPMTEEPAEQKPYSEPAVSAILDYLIDATYEVAAARRSVEEYRNTQQRPALPQARVFQDTASLTEYVNAVERYEEGLDQAIAHLTRCEQTLEGREEKVKAILPLNTHVFHSYAIRRSELATRSGRYQITHSPGGLIQVLEVDD
jgi:hypothetical protein